MNTTDAFVAHVKDLQGRAALGDGFAIKSLAALALLSEGWRPGDPDPSDEPPDGGCEIIHLAEYRMELAA